jgi:hypothetical protein
MNAVGSFVLMAVVMIGLMVLLLCGVALFVLILAKIIEDEIDHRSMSVRME